PQPQSTPPASPPMEAPDDDEITRVDRPALVEQPAIEEAAERKALQDRSIRVSVELLDSLGLLAGDLLVESARARLRNDELSQLLERFSRMGDNFLKVYQTLPSLGRDGSHDRLDRLEGDLHLLRDDAFRF